MKISKQEKIELIHLLSMLVIAVLAITILWIPQIKKSKRYNDEAASLKKVVDKLIQIEQNQSVFENKKNKVMQDLNAIQEKITVKPMISQAIEQVTKPMNELGISLISITPGDSIDKGRQTEEVVISSEGYFETPIELSMLATYKQIATYLDVLRHLPRLIVIDEFDIRSDKGISPKLAIRLKLSVFHYEKD